MLSGRFLNWLGIGFLAASIAACVDNGDKPPQPGASGTSGRVGVLLTDAPVSAHDFAHIYMTVTGVTLLGDQFNSAANNAPLFTGESTIDLLHLADYSELFTLASDIPAGDYEKIRLTLSKLELVKVDSSGNAQSFFPKLPGNGKIDLNPRGTIHIEGGQTVLVQIDVDVEKSIHIVETGKGDYNFRPVIFVDVITADFPGKLVRRTGYVHQLNTTDATFALCAAPSTQTQAKDDDLPCLGVTTTNASVFATDGTPAAFANLANDDRVTAIGFLNGSSSVNEKTVMLFAELNAEVIEIGGPNPWVIERGAVAGEPANATDAFKLQLDNVNALSAQLQTGSKVFARDGTRLDFSAITLGTEAAVDGVIDANDATLLKSSLVVINTGSVLDHTSGPIQTIDYGMHTMTVTTSSGDIDVQTHVETTIFQITKSGDTTTSAQIQFSALKAGQTVDLYGHVDSNGIFQADVILVEGT